MGCPILSPKEGILILQALKRFKKKLRVLWRKTICIAIAKEAIWIDSYDGQSKMAVEVSQPCMDSAQGSGHATVDNDEGQESFARKVVLR